MLLVEMWNSKKALSRVAGQPAGEIRVLPAPTQEKEEDLTNSITAAAAEGEGVRAKSL